MSLGVSQAQLNAFSEVKEVYDNGLDAAYLIFNMGEAAFKLSKGAKSCALLPIQRMARLYHRQTSTSNLWPASASTLRQLLHSSSISAHICKQAGSKWGRRITVCTRSLSTLTQLDFNSYIKLKRFEDASDPYTRDRRCQWRS